MSHKALMNHNVFNGQPTNMAKNDPEHLLNVERNSFLMAHY